VFARADEEPEAEGGEEEEEVEAEAEVDLEEEEEEDEEDEAEAEAEKDRFEPWCLCSELETAETGAAAELAFELRRSLYIPKQRCGRARSSASIVRPESSSACRSAPEQRQHSSSITPHNEGSATYPPRPTSERTLHQHCGREPGEVVLIESC
jgi:hypothetical protein